MKTALCALAFASAISLYSFAAYATAAPSPSQSPSPSPAAITTSGASSGNQRHGPCHEDVQKFCSTVQKGGHRVLDCLTANEGKLSPRCEAAMKRHEKQGAPTGQAAPATAPATAPTK